MTTQDSRPDPVDGWADPAETREFPVFASPHPTPLSEAQPPPASPSRSASVVAAAPATAAQADPSATPVVEMTGVGRTFPGPPEVQAVQDVQLTVQSGEYLSIVGPSGSGKSTLLHLLGLLDRPTQGTYRLDGEDVSGLSERRRAVLRGERIGFVFQAFHLLAHRSVLENVALSMLYSRVPRKDRLTRARAALDRVKMSHRVDFAPSTLSGGERQRVAIARALVTEPSLLLADEPTGNLDSASSEAVLAVFDELHAQGITLAVITHNDEVSFRAQRRVRIVDGTLREEVFVR